MQSSSLDILNTSIDSKSDLALNSISYNLNNTTSNTPQEENTCDSSQIYTFNQHLMTKIDHNMSMIANGI